MSYIYKLIIALFLFYTIQSAGNIETKRYDLDSQPKDLVWCGNNHEKVLVITEMDSLYRSDDKGFIWKKLNDVLTTSGKAELEEHENEV